MNFPAKVIHQNKIGTSQIRLRQTNGQQLPDKIMQLVNREWDQQVLTNPKLTNGGILVARGIGMQSDIIQLFYHESTYKNFMGTTASAEIPEEFRQRAIGVMCVITTADNYLVFGIRSPKIDWGTLRHVVPACRMGLHDNHPEGALRREAKEELGLEVQDFEVIQCVGIVSDLTWGRLNYEFVYTGKIKITAREVAEKAATAASANEHCQLEFMPKQPEVLATFLSIDPEGWVPTGWAGTCLALAKELNMNFLPWEPTHRTYQEHMGRRLKMLVK